MAVIYIAPLSKESKPNLRKGDVVKLAHMHAIFYNATIFERRRAWTNVNEEANDFRVGLP